MERLESEYDERQREAILAPINRPLVIYAGPGSGKTRTLVGRVARFVVDGVDPRRMVVITFTRKAARELKERLRHLLGEEVNLGYVGTFHGFGARLLRILGGYRGRDADFIIYDEKDQLDLMKKVLLALHEEKRMSPQKACELVESFKRNLLVPENVSSYEHVEELYRVYDETLVKNNACDFADLLMLPVLKLRSSRGELKRLREEFVYFFVDEYQDVNLAQYTLLKLFEEGRGFITVVGDEDQSIYGWRGAEFEYVLRFRKDFPNANEVVLNVNYRSPASIVLVAERLIQHNTLRTEKNLVATFDEHNAVVFKVFETPEDEAEWVVNYIERKVHSGCNYEQFAVLYRANYQSRNFEHKLVSRGMPYTVVKGQRFYARKEVKDFLSLLRLVVSPSSYFDWSRVVQVFVSGVGERTLETVFEKYGDPFKMEELCERPLKRTEAKLLNFVRKFESLLSSSKTPAEFVMKCAEAFHYEDLLVDEYGEPEGYIRFENVVELAAALEGAYQRKGKDFKSFLAEFLEEVVLETEADQKTKGVSLLTLHSAKGLEFDYVFVIGFEQGNLPHYYGDLEEERRLAYVGITRAKKRVFLTRVMYPRHGGKKPEFTRPSVFLKEMGFVEEEWYG